MNSSKASTPRGRIIRSRSIRTEPAVCGLLIFLAAASASDLPAQVPSALEGPAVQRGFSADQAFSIGDIDHINSFNGNLILTLPIGQSYGVNAGLSYQTILTYNANLWDFDGRSEPGDPFENVYSIATAHPGFNAGAGWQLSLGKLLPTGTVLNDTGSWLYVSADGSSHRFFSTLHQTDPEDVGDTAGSQNTLYSRDGSYLRHKTVGASFRSVEFPSGEIHTF